MRMESNWIFHTLLVGMQNDTANLEKSWAASYKVKHTLTMKLGVSPLTTYPRETKIYVYAKICTGTFTAVLFTIDKNKNNPNVHSQVNG